MSITAQDFFDWLAAHDVDYHHIKSVEFVPEGVHKEDGVQMRVVRYVLNSEGKRFFDLTSKARDGEHQVAQEVIFVPLKSLPGVAPQAQPVS